MPCKIWTKVQQICMLELNIMESLVFDIPYVYSVLNSALQIENMINLDRYVM